MKMPQNKTKDFNLSVGINTKNITIPDNQEYVDIEGYASKSMLNGEKVVDLAGEHVETSGFDLIAKRILLNHNHQEPVGELKLTHKPDGIAIHARVYKKAMEEKEFERVKLGLYDFSIGFFATDAEYKMIGGKDVLCFTKGSVYETSLVAIPCNTEATHTSIKSLMDDGDLPTKRELEKALREHCGLSKRQATKVANAYNPTVDILPPIIDDITGVEKLLEETLAKITTV